MAAPISTCANLIVRDLGRMAYAEALGLQRLLQQEVMAWRDGRKTRGNSGACGYLLLVEHDPPVITISRRPCARQHLIATPQQLDAAGIEVEETDRGGDITYHGPGQLVVYPILDLNRLGLRLQSYMRFLEQVVIDTLARFGIEGFRDETATGVWVTALRVGPSPSPVAPGHQNGPASKICALGVRVSRWVTMHGLALNVTPNLDHFNLIVPCGLTGRGVSSMQQLLGERCPSIEQVRQAFINQFMNAVCGRVTESPVS